MNQPLAARAQERHAHLPATGAVLPLSGVLGQVVNDAPVGFVQADRMGRITRSNRRWCEMLQYSERDMCQLSIQALTHPEDRPATLAAVQELVQGAASFSLEQRYLRRDGSLLWATSSVTALRGTQGQYQGLVAVVQDVSQRKAQELELQRLAQDLALADQRKSEFLATLAHELRNPLAPLSQALQVLQRDPDHRDRVLQSAEIMARQVRHLVHLVDELLDIARIAQGKISLQRCPTELTEVVQSALDLSTPLIRQHQHQLCMQLPQEPVHVHADITRLAQVLGNLLNNAAKYTPDGGQICLEGSVEAGRLKLSVRDNGVGIAAEDLPHIFDLFSQVGRSMDMAQGGLGIGLSLARQLVELHGGQLSAHSDGPGRGSVFTVDLPTCEGGRDAQAQDAPQPSAAAQALRLLVVDDNADGADTLAELLRMSGHATEVAYDGPAAIDKAAASQPQAAFLDLGMPGMDGYALAQALRRAHPDLRLIALTGWASDADRQRTLAAGFERHLIKPVDLAAIDEALQGLVPATSTLTLAPSGQGGAVFHRADAEDLRPTV